MKFFSQMIKEGKVTCYLQRSFYISCFLLLDTIFETLYTESPFFIYNTQKVCHMSDNSPTFHLYFNGTLRAQFHSTLIFVVSSPCAMHCSVVLNYPVINILVSFQFSVIIKIFMLVTHQCFMYRSMLCLLLFSIQAVILCTIDLSFTHQFRMSVTWSHV